MGSSCDGDAVLLVPRQIVDLRDPAEIDRQLGRWPAHQGRAGAFQLRPGHVLAGCGQLGVAAAADRMPVRLQADRRKANAIAVVPRRRSGAGRRDR